MGTLAIRDREFNITEATLSGGLYVESGATRVGATGTWFRRKKPRAEQRPIWGCNWILNIETDGREFASDDSKFPETWQPRAYSENLPLQVRSWKELDGLTIECDGPSQEEKCQLIGPFHLYVYEHADVTRNRLHFSEINGTSLNLDWDGLCNVYAGDYFEDIPFRVKTRVEFIGIRIVESDPSAAHAVISHILNPQEYTQLDPKFRDWGDERLPHDGPKADIWFKPKP